MLILLALGMAGPAAGRNLRMDSTEAAAGSTAIAWVSLDNAAGLAAVEFQINYDRNLLTFISATNPPGTLGGEFTLSVETGDGLLILRLYRDSHLSSGAGDLLALSFAVNAGAEPGMSAPLVLAKADMVNQYGADLRWESEVGMQGATFSVAQGQGSADVLFTRYAGSGGGISGSPGGYYSPGSSATITAEPAPYFHFVGWSGDTEGSTNSPGLALILNRPRSVTAHFASYVTTNTSTPHWWLAQYGLTNQPFETEAELDSDEDGVLNWQEYIAGADPTNPASHLSELKWHGDQLQIEGSVAEREYLILYRTNLLLGAWMEYTNRVGTGSDLFFDPQNTSATIFFQYRVRLPE